MRLGWVQNCGNIHYTALCTLSGRSCQSNNWWAHNSMKWSLVSLMITIWSKTANLTNASLSSCKSTGWTSDPLRYLLPVICRKWQKVRQCPTKHFVAVKQVVKQCTDASRMFVGIVKEESPLDMLLNITEKYEYSPAFECTMHYSKTKRTPNTPVLTWWPKQAQTTISNFHQGLPKSRGPDVWPSHAIMSTA